MNAYLGTPVQRLAVYTVHGEKCYQCSKPLDLQSVEIDHIVPKCLREKPAELVQVLMSLGLPSSFKIDGFENLLPSCRPCNLKKKDIPWKPSLIVQSALQRAEAKAPDVIALASQTFSRKRITSALTILQQVSEEGSLTAKDIEAIRELTRYQVLIRIPEMKDKPVRITRTISIGIKKETKDDCYIITIPGFTLGLGPDGAEFESHSVICSKCGGKRFINGVVCLDCGCKN